MITKCFYPLKNKKVRWFVFGFLVAVVIILIVRFSPMFGVVMVRVFPLSVLLVVGTGTIVTVCICVVRSRKANEPREREDDDIEQLQGQWMPKRFNYEQLREATNEFREKLGAGGFGSVFRGILGNGQEIAVKCLEGSGQGKKEFVAEVRTIGSIHHINLVKLIGYCIEKNRRDLVYEFMRNGSLDKWIFSNHPQWSLLTWQAKKRIIQGVAKGLTYLHEDCSQKIVHLDIKPQNILLDASFEAKISDFGMSRLIDRDQSRVMTIPRGTYGYMAPEVCQKLAFSEKADVYSFGVVVMEIICGRKNLDRSQPEDLVSELMKAERENRIVDLIDQSTDMELHKAEAVEMLKLAIWCVQIDSNRRPPMSMVVKVLEGTMCIPENLEHYSSESPATMSAMSVEPSVLSGPR